MRGNYKEGRGGSEVMGNEPKYSQQMTLRIEPISRYGSSDSPSNMNDDREQPI